MVVLGNILDVTWLVATGGFVVAILALAFYVKVIIPRKFEKMVHDAVLEVGSPLKDAQVTVHSVSAAAAPKGPSPYDLDEDDENYMEDLDGQPWDQEGCNFYSIDVTIEPADANAKWDPTGLALVPADYVPDDEVEISEKLCGLHSAEMFVNGQFRPCPEGEISGSRRLRMLFAVHEGLRAVKFANVVTYFGHVDLPAPTPNAK